MFLYCLPLLQIVPASWCTLDQAMGKPLLLACFPWLAWSTSENDAFMLYIGMPNRWDVSVMWRHWEWWSWGTMTVGYDAGGMHQSAVLLLRRISNGRVGRTLRQSNVCRNNNPPTISARNNGRWEYIHALPVGIIIALGGPSVTSAVTLTPGSAYGYNRGTERHTDGLIWRFENV